MNWGFGFIMIRICLIFILLFCSAPFLKAEEGTTPPKEVGIEAIAVGGNELPRLCGFSRNEEAKLKETIQQAKWIAPVLSLCVGFNGHIKVASIQFRGDAGLNHELLSRKALAEVAASLVNIAFETLESLAEVDVWAVRTSSPQKLVAESTAVVFSLECLKETWLQLKQTGSEKNSSRFISSCGLVYFSEDIKR